MLQSFLSVCKCVLTDSLLKDELLFTMGDWLEQKKIKGGEGVLCISLCMRRQTAD